MPFHSLVSSLGHGVVVLLGHPRAELEVSAHRVIIHVLCFSLAGCVVFVAVLRVAVAFAIMLAS